MQYKNNRSIRYSFLIILGLLFSINQTYSQGFDDDLESFRKSISYEYEGNYTKAISSLKKTYKESSYEYNSRLGYLDYLAGQYLESVSYYNKAISLKPLSIEARFGLIYPQLALGKTNLAIELYLQILEISPNETKANYRLGLIYYQLGKYKEAETHLKKIINLFPFDYDTVILLGWNSLAMGKINEAKVLFQKALLYNPSDENATEGLRLTN